MGWICKNEACDRFGIEVTETKEVISFDSEGRKVNSAERCPRCGARRIDTTEPWDGSAPSVYGHNVANSYSV